MSDSALEFEELDDLPIESNHNGKANRQRELEMRRRLEYRLELRDLKAEFGFTDKELMDLYK